MKQKELSILLRGIVALCALPWLLLAYAYGKTLVLCFLEPDYVLAPTALICLMLALVLLAMIDAWLIFTRIGQNNSFCKANANALKRISLYALTATGLDLLLIVYTIIHLGDPLVVGNILLHTTHYELLFLLFVAVGGVCATIVTAALSHLTLKAASLQDENDLTI